MADAVRLPMFVTYAEAGRGTGREVRVLSSTSVYRRKNRSLIYELKSYKSVGLAIYCTSGARPEEV